MRHDSEQHPAIPITGLIAAAMLALSVPGCSVYRGFDVSLSPAPHEFPGLKLREVLTGSEQLFPSLDSVTIGVGSGRQGFESLTLTANGQLEVVFDHPSREGRFISAKRCISASAAKEFLDSRTVLSSRSLQKSYSADLADGTQAFLFVRSEIGDKFVWFNNRFPMAFTKIWSLGRTLVETLPDKGWAFQSADGFNQYSRAHQRQTTADSSPQSSH